MAKVRAIPELPCNGSMSPRQRRIQVDMRQNTIGVRKAQSPPTTPTNLKVTPLAFNNMVQWTRSVNADFYEVLWSSTPQLSGATAVAVGDSAQWTDNVGQSGITRYYWVRGRKFTGVKSIEAGPQAGTTLAATTGVTPPTPPPASQTIVQDQRFNRYDYSRDL